MDERRSNIEPWDSGSYETGSTRPPKSHRGLIAFLLILVIFLGGISSALGVLNIRLLAQQGEDPEASDPMLQYPNSSVPSVTETSGPADAVTVPVPTDKPELELNKTPVASDNVPQAGGLPLQTIYAGAIDSVVSISCKVDSGAVSGSGVVLSKNGFIVTNSHVVEGASAITVCFTDDRTLPARIVGADTISDLAVLYVDAADLTPAVFGDSSALRVGDAVAAIGDPLGMEFRGSMTDGIVSAINREVSVSGRSMTLIQTNAALNAGNSGGPLLNCYGQVIGINTMKIGAFTDASGVEGIGFAIPSVTVKEIVDQLVNQGYVSGRPSLGIQGKEVSFYYQQFYRLPAGFCISGIQEGSCTEAAGLKAGDVIVAFNDARVTDADSLSAALYACSAGDQISLTVYRKSGQRTFSVTLDEAGI